jgi:hypothetical protein
MGAFYATVTLLRKTHTRKLADYTKQTYLVHVILAPKQKHVTNAQLLDSLSSACKPLRLTCFLPVFRICIQMQLFKRRTGTFR